MNSAQIGCYASGSNSHRDRLAMTSISLDVAGLVSAPGLRARVESAFAEACNLVAENGQRFSLVSDRIGDGPLNAVVGDHGGLCTLSLGDRVTGDGRWLVLDPFSGESVGSVRPILSHPSRLQQSMDAERGFRVDLQQARLWDPCPDYARLGFRPSIVMSHVASLGYTLPLEAPPASLAARPGCSTQEAFGSHLAEARVQARAEQLTNGLLAAYRHGDLAGIHADARQLAGLGPGLTPAGDDWLGGWLVGLHVRAAIDPTGAAAKRPAVADVGQVVVDAAAGRTSGLSLAYLSAAARGAVPRVWHDFLSALVDADPGPVQRFAAEIMRHGATSGADMLAGFVAAFVQGPSYA